MALRVYIFLEHTITFYQRQISYPGPQIGGSETYRYIQFSLKSMYSLLRERKKNGHAFRTVFRHQIVSHVRYFHTYMYLGICAFI